MQADLRRPKVDDRVTPKAWLGLPGPFTISHIVDAHPKQLYLIEGPNRRGLFSEDEFDLDPATLRSA